MQVQCLQKRVILFSDVICFHFFSLQDLTILQLLGDLCLSAYPQED